VPAKRSWRVRLTATAEADFQDILGWTAEKFGEAQASAYAKTLSDAIEALTDGPMVPGAKASDEIGRGLLTLHVARDGHKGRHFVLFQIGCDDEKAVIEVLRLLHDAMDLARHTPSVGDPEES